MSDAAWAGTRGPSIWAQSGVRKLLPEIQMQILGHNHQLKLETW